MRKHPELGTKTDLLFKRASGGDESAYAFLCVFDEYFEDVVGFIKKGPHREPEFVQLLARTNTVYSLPFYVRNGHFLWQPIQQAFASLRHDPAPLCMARIAMAVANIKLGFVEAQKLDVELRETALAAR